MEAVINTCINKAVVFYDVIHRFPAGRGTGTAIMDIKISQELASVDHDPIFLMFLDLQKAYENLDPSNLLHTL